MKPAPSATRTAPATPTPMPPATNAPRCGTPRVAAQTTETISAASSTSRNTSNATAGIGLLHDQPAIGRVAVKIAEEAVRPGTQRTDVDDDAALRQDDGFPVEVGTFELLGTCVLVDDANLESRAGGNLERAGLVDVVS